jgi:hypothetical protein
MSTPYFNDDNTLSDIQGCIYVAQDFDRYFPGKSRTQKLDEIVARIEAKLVKIKNPTRHNWFSIALDFARQACAAYAAGDLERGRDLLRRTEEYLVSGNKAHRRKTAFLVGFDGTTHPADESAAPNNERRA